MRLAGAATNGRSASALVEPGQGRRLRGTERRITGQLAQPIDPVEDRWMGVHQPRRARLELLDRVGEVHVLRAAIGDLEYLLVARDLGQRTLQAVWVSRQLDRRRVGEVLALPTHRELDEPADDRREDGEDDRDDGDDRLRAIAALAVRRAPATGYPAPEG